MERRSLSGWCVLSVLLVVVFFGLFFAFTERRSWPERRTLLSPGDMRFAPSTSTFWCEGIDLRSQHPFVAYQVTGDPHISVDIANGREWNMTLKGRNNHHQPFFLLPGSTIEVFSCSSQKLLLFKGESTVDECLRRGWSKESSESVEDDSSSEEVDDPCPSLVEQASPTASDKCARLRANISEADTYVVVMVGRTTSVSVRVHRSRYSVRKTGSAFRMCSLANSCTIGLSWGSTERALLFLPEEDSTTGIYPVKVYSWCRPRLALFALLSVMLPLTLFLGAALALRKLRQRHLHNAIRQRAEPLIPGPPTNDPPPAYETLDDPPPPYAGLKSGR